MVGAVLHEGKNQCYHLSSVSDTRKLQPGSVTMEQECGGKGSTVVAPDLTGRWTWARMAKKWIPSPSTTVEIAAKTG